MPRRHGWLHDYEQELDNGSRRMPVDQGQGSTSPVTINININLGDIIDKLIGGKRTAREALEEMVAAKEGRLLLIEDDED